MGQSNRTPPVKGTSTLPSAAQVRSYLRANPGFLMENADLLSVLQPPARFAQERGVVDFQTAMIHRLRGDVSALRDSAETLVSLSRSNAASQSSTFDAVLAILRCNDLDALAMLVTHDLPLILGVDVAALVLETGGPKLGVLYGAEVRLVAPGTVDTLVPDPEGVVLLSNLEGDEALFGEGAGLVHSQARARLDHGSSLPPGLLVLGSRDPSWFSPDQGTDLLAFLAQVLAHTIRPCLHPKTRARS